MNSFTSPTRFASQPVIGIEMAFATPNEVITRALRVGRPEVTGDGWDRHVSDGGVEYLHERRQRQGDGHQN